MRGSRCIERLGRASLNLSTSSASPTNSGYVAFRARANPRIQRPPLVIDEMEKGGLYGYQSSYGEIRSAWNMKGSAVTWLVAIPPNSTAHLPLKASEQNKFTLDGQQLAASKKVRLLSSADETSTWELPAGTYSFQVSKP